MTDNTLPQYAYAVHPSDSARVILLKRGKLGFWDAMGMTLAAADSRNAAMGVSHAMREAMQAGSMWGWDCKAANNPDLFFAADALVEEYADSVAKSYMPMVDHEAPGEQIVG